MKRFIYHIYLKFIMLCGLLSCQTFAQTQTQLPISADIAWYVTPDAAMSYFTEIYDYLESNGISKYFFGSNIKILFLEKNNRLYFCPFFYQPPSRSIRRLYFDITDVLPIYEKQLSKNTEQLLQLHKLALKIRDKKSADEAAEEMFELFLCFKKGSRGTNIPDPIYWHIMEKHSIEHFSIAVEIVRIIGSSYYGSELLRQSFDDVYKIYQHINDKFI